MTDEYDPHELSRQVARERAEALTYPAEPDSRGSVRLSWQGKRYYFGRHNTPSSFITFCEWRRLLIATGQAPEVKDVRLDLAHRSDAVNRKDSEHLGEDGEASGEGGETSGEGGESGILASPVFASPGWMVIAASAVLLFSLAYGMGQWTAASRSPIEKGSSGDSVVVDSLPLSRGEIEMIRGLRVVSAKQQAADVSSSQRLAEVKAKLMDMDPQDAKHFVFKVAD